VGSREEDERSARRRVMDRRESYTKVFRCTGCGAMFRVALSQRVRPPGDTTNRERAIEAVKGECTALVKDGRTYTAHCTRCGTEQDHWT
jgi:transcription elongation factor Elf1